MDFYRAKKQNAPVQVEEGWLCILYSKVDTWQHKLVTTMQRFNDLCNAQDRW